MGKWDKYAEPVADKWDKYAEGGKAAANPETATEPLRQAGSGTPEPSRLQNISNIWNPKADESVKESFVKSPGRVWQTAGQVLAGTISDPIASLISTSIKAIYEAGTPEDVQKAFRESISGLTQSGGGQAAIEGIKKVMDAYGEAKKNRPELFANLEAGGNILGALPMGVLGILGVKTATGTPKVVKDIVVDAAKGAKGSILEMAVPKSVAAIDALEEKIVREGYSKGIRPTVIGQGDAGLRNKHYADATTAIRDIVNKVDTPISKAEKPVEAFSEASLATKKSIWADARAISSEAKKEGALIDLNPVIGRIREMGADANLARTNKPLADFLNMLADEWAAKPTKIDPIEAEDLIARLNLKAKDYWRDPNTRSNAALFEDIARATRKQTYDVMESFKGKEYESLRKRYGAQLAIEKEVADRATIVGRRPEFGFFDLANIPAAAEVASAIATMDPTKLARAAGYVVAKKGIKYLNDPDTIVRKMFEKMERYEGLKKKLAPVPEASGAAKQGPHIGASDIDRLIADEAAKRAAIGDAEGYFAENIPPTNYGLPGVPRRMPPPPYQPSPLPPGSARVQAEEEARQLAQSKEFQRILGGRDAYGGAPFIPDATTRYATQDYVRKLREILNKQRLGY